MSRIGRLLTHRFHIARFGVPIWTTLLALVIITGTAAQAVGPVLSAQIRGTIGMAVGGVGGIAVSQAIKLSTDANMAHTVLDADDGVIAVNDDGTGFTVAIEAFENSTAKIRLDLVNDSGKLAYAVISLTAPEGITLDAEEVTGETDGIKVARLSQNTWLLKVPATETDADADIEYKLGAKAGFYNISASIIQMSPG